MDGEQDNIIRITIKSASGYGPIEDAYNDMMTICRDSIRYEYIPEIQSENNKTWKWSYKTNSQKFQELFDNITVAIDTVLTLSEELFATDVGPTTFTVTYSDKSKIKRTFLLPSDDFADLYSIVRKMIPPCESIPKMLLTWEDFEDYSE